MLPFDVLKLWIELVQRFLMSSLDLELGIVLGLSSSSMFLIIDLTVVSLYWDCALDWPRA